MYVVITKVQLKSGQIETVQKLFEETNPALVESQTEWLRAIFTANKETNQVTILAFWKNSDAYQKFSSSSPFQQVMSQFSNYFASPPDVTINEVLFEM